MPRGFRFATLVVLVVGLSGCGAGDATLSPGPASTAPATETATPSATPTPAASRPDRIAFGRFNTAVGGFQVFTMRPDGSDQRVLIGGVHGDPRWAPDGTQISVTSFESGYFLRILRTDGSVVRVLKRPDSTIRLACDAWSPDASRLACEGWDTVHPDRIGLYSVRASDGGNLTRLTAPKDRHHDIPGDYSPDGTRIAYIHVTSASDETGELWLVNADGTAAHRASDLVVGTQVRWSPDGRWLVGDSMGSLVVFDAANPSAAPRMITILGQPATSPSWSPDGTRIAFTTIRIGETNEDIATVAADGTDLQMLTGDPAKEGFPDWGLAQ